MRPYRKFLPAFLLMLCPGLAGCPSPNQDAIAINGAGAIASVILINDGDPSGAAQAVTISGQLAAAIKNFVPGSSAQNIVQLGQAFVAILQADSTSKAAEEISTVLGTVLNIVSEYEPSNTVGIATANVVSAAATGHIAPTQGLTPRTKSQLYAAVNAQLKANPVPGLKPLK